MNAQDIIALQDIAKLYNREHMFCMINEREDIVSKALNRVAEQELEYEDCELEELAALNR